MSVRAAGRALAALLWATAAGAAAGETPTVVYEDGLLAIRCADAPLGHILDQVKAAAGMDLILEGAAPTARLTVHLDAQPMSLALPRLLEGTGVNYLLVADGADPRRVATLYVGGAKAGGPAAASPVTAADRRAARPRTAPPMAEPEALPIPELPADPEPDDDDEVDTTAEVEPPPGPAATPGLAPGASGGQPMLDPFGRAIPMRGADRQGRAVRRGRGNGADEQ